MKVVGVAALLALLALCEGLGVVKEGPLKKHDRKKDSLTSSTQLKEDKKEASVLRLTGQPLVPKRDTVTDAKPDVIGVETGATDAKTSVLEAKNNLINNTKSAVSKDEEVSLRVRQQLRHSVGLGGETAAKQPQEGELALAKTAVNDPESKVVQLGNAQITLGNPTSSFNGIGNLADISFGALGNLFGIGNGLGTTIFNSLPSITFGGISGGQLLSGISGVGIGGTLFGGIVGIGAAVAAGLAAILAFIVPGLQIANQILAIIAISMLGAYLAEDKGGDEYYDTGYDSGTGYEDSGTGYSLSGSGGGYGSSPGVLGSGTGYSSYSDYRRSALAQAPFDGYTNLFGQQQGLAANSIDGSGLDGLFAGTPILAAAGKPVVTGRSGRSMVSDGLVKRVGSLVSDAVEKYSEIYGDRKEVKVGKE